MKNRNKVLTVVTVFALGFISAMGTVSATRAYIEWKGAPSYRSSVDNLTAVSGRYDELLSEITALVELSSENSDTITHLEEYNKTLTELIVVRDQLITGRDVSIRELQAQVLERDATIEVLIKEVEKVDLENEQALIDMQDLEIRIADLLEKIK